MDTIGIVRRLDDLNRISIPKEIIREIYGKSYSEGAVFEIYMKKDNTIIMKPYKKERKWCPIVNSFGELTEFLCDCGCSSQSASNYCPNCGTNMDNSDIEKRIQLAIKEAL